MSGQHTVSTFAQHTHQCPTHTPVTQCVQHLIVLVVTRVHLYQLNPYLAQDKGQGGEVHLDDQGLRWINPSAIYPLIIVTSIVIVRNVRALLF